MIYPGSSPEFRILVKENNEQELQVRYVNLTQKYTGKWTVVPKVIEHEPHQPVDLKAGEWRGIEALEDETVFVNVFAEGKQ